jgi:hypothetical protein
MRINTRRNFFGKMATIVAFVTGAPKLSANKLPLPRLKLVAHPRTRPPKTLLVGPAAITTHSTGSTISLGRVLMTVIPKNAQYPTWQSGGGLYVCGCGASSMGTCERSHKANRVGVPVRFRTSNRLRRTHLSTFVGSHTSLILCPQGLMAL